MAFSDNSSVICGFNTLMGSYNKDKELQLKRQEIHCVLTAETHNFPTLVCPFQGASTGIGGRIRDNQSTGRGANIIHSLAGYIVGDINRTHKFKNTPYTTPINMLIEASNGASDYGNKIGEPITLGFTRSICYKTPTDHYEYLKPIMFSAGIGSILDGNTFKNIPKYGDLIVRLGGPVYKIGLGGGYSSSITNGDLPSSLANQTEKNAVQRGDPQMENKLNRVIRYLSCLDKNPIISIHDQGAGGLANVVKEISYPLGGIIELKNVTLGDMSLTPLEIWCSEFQESNVIVINKDDVDIVKDICVEENIYCDILGNITNTGNIEVFYYEENIVLLPLKPVIEPTIRKTYCLTSYLDKESEYGDATPLNSLDLKFTCIL